MKRENIAALTALCVLISIVSVVAEDFTLEIFGNANMDDTIDEEDIEYVEEVIKGTKESTNLTDANNDGIVDEKDVEQIRQIIDGSEKELTFIDYDGMVETVHLPVKRIVATYGYHAWAVEMLGGKDRIIAVDETIKNEQSTVFPDIKNLPSIGSSEYDIEKIIELKPDIVMIYTRDWLTKGTNPNLEKTIEEVLPNTTVFVSMPRNMGSFKSEMSKLAYILGEKQGGDELINWYEGYIEDISERLDAIPVDQKIRVFLGDNDELAEAGTSYHTYGSTDEGANAVNSVIRKAGGKNIASNLSGDFIEVEAEWVLEQNPDLILIDDWTVTGYRKDDPSEAAEVRDNFLNRTELKGTNAAKNGRVYLINSAMMHTEWFIGIPYLVKLMYPDLFEALNPEEIHQEFLSSFRGLDYDLNEHGVFVYPPIKMDGGLSGVPG